MMIKHFNKEKLKAIKFEIQQRDYNYLFEQYKSPNLRVKNENKHKFGK